jgi:hypothetical protein
MTVKEVIEELQKMPQTLEVQVHDGMDPSDRRSATVVELGQDYFDKTTVVFITA